MTDTPIQDQINMLLDNPDSFENPVQTLGTLCGKRAVANCKKDPTSIKVWIPFNQDWDDLKQLLGEPSDTACLNFREAETMKFVDAFSEGALEAIKGRKQTSEACDELDGIFSSETTTTTQRKTP